MAAIKITHEELREELRAGKSATEIAKAYGMTHSVVLRRIKKLKATGYDPANDRDYNNPENHPVAGYSTLVRHKSANDSSTGKVLEWVKTRVDVREQMDAATAMLDTMISDIKPLPVIPYRNKVATTDQFTVIPIGDPHIGLMTWSKEVGEDWDIKIADRVYRKVFKRLLSNLPDTEECILVNTGDFFHADNIQGETSRSKHKLDLDGRHGKWLDAGFVMVRKKGKLPPQTVSVSYELSMPQAEDITLMEEQMRQAREMVYSRVKLECVEMKRHIAQTCELKRLNINQDTRSGRRDKASTLRIRAKALFSIELIQPAK